MTRHKNTHISTLGSQVTSVISVALVLVIVGIMALMASAAHLASDSLRGEMAMICRLDLGATAADADRMKQEFGRAGYLSSWLYTSPDDVLAQEMEYNADIIGLLDENPYSGEFELRLKPAYVNPDSMNMIAMRLESIDCVDEVVSPAEAAAAVNAAYGKLMLVLSVVGAALLLISIVLINNTISLSIYSRRFLIHSMRLVGATGGFIRRPFVKAGVIMGVLAGALASCVVCGIQGYVRTVEIDFLLAMPWPAVAAVCAGLVVLGVIICGLSAVFATNRYLRLSYDKMFQK